MWIWEVVMEISRNKTNDVLFFYFYQQYMITSETDLLTQRMLQHVYFKGSKINLHTALLTSYNNPGYTVSFISNYILHF